ncbi:hypothetical protein [Mesorhizobium sp. M0185]|uniref:hypothetical protein n=1 Tax=Mesorhizobium sp. M0185 TaxID=2956907 RepID=UPI00333D908B
MREVDERSGTGEGALLTMRRASGLVPLSNFSDKIAEPERLRHYKLASPGQIVMNPMQAGNGMFAICRTPGLISPDYRAFELTDEADARYLIALFKSEAMRATFRAESKGLGTGTAGFLRLYPERFGSLFAPFPPPEEQRRIADFLDAYTAQVHRLVATKRRTIAALVERKRSITTNRLYVSGNAELPLAPRNPDWQLRAIKRIADISFSSVDKHVYEHERQVRVCNYVDVYRNDRVTLATPFREGSVTEAEYASFALKAGDVLVTKDSEDWKDICVPCLVADDVPDAVCGYHLAVLRPNTEQISGKYLYFSLLAAPTTWQFHKAATGITRYGVGKNEIGTAVIPLPSICEQDEICLALEEELASVDAAKDKVIREIDLIVEYRDSLIAAVVTGRLDVREAMIPSIEGDDLADHAATEDEDMEDALDAPD